MTGSISRSDWSMGSDLTTAGQTVREKKKVRRLAECLAKARFFSQSGFLLAVSFGVDALLVYQRLA